MTSSQFTADASLRVDIFLSERTGLTRSNIKKLCENGHVTVAGKPARAGQVLRVGEEVTLTVPDPVPIAAKAEDIPLDIVYEDEDLAVINKPQGMTVHAGAGNYEGTLVNALLFRLDSLSGINGELRPGIVHRIDKDTSGLLVVAKNDMAHLSLSKQIEEKSCKREYLALLEGVLAQEKGQVATDIGRDPKDRLRMAVVPAGTGRRAVTDYTVERRFRSHTLVRFSLQTGRTHQIRVHAKHLGHPVVGDMTYGFKKQRFQLSGQLLHAYRLELTHPRTGERMEFFAPLPDYFEHVLDVLEKTEQYP